MASLDAALVRGWKRWACRRKAGRTGRDAHPSLAKVMGQSGCSASATTKVCRRPAKAVVRRLDAGGAPWEERKDDKGSELASLGGLHETRARMCANPGLTISARGQ